MEKFINELKKISEIEAIAIGGSQTAKTSDDKSDTDIYVFSKTNIPIEVRKNIIEPISDLYEIGGEYFGSGDEFFYNKLNIQFDVMYWNINWFENIVDNIWTRHNPSNGYTTCFLYTLKNFNILYDKNNWLKNLQETINKPYPIELKNILKHVI